MDLAGSSHVLEFTFTPDPEDETSKILSATLDGEEIVDSNVRRLYVKVLSPFFYVFTEVQEPGEIEYRLKIIYATGEEYLMEFAKLNERQYQVIKDGEDTGYYVNVTDLTAISKAIERVKNGEILSMSD